MATATLQWPIAAATLPDGSSGNAAPAISRLIGTESNPKKFLQLASFDAATDEHLHFIFRVPADYASGGDVKLLWMVNSASANNVVWGARIAIITPADADTPVEHAAAAASTTTTAGNATEARRLIETSITLANLDSIAAGDLAALIVYRDADNGSDTLAADAELLNVALTYTTT
jgi:hypothetical protein